MTIDKTQLRNAFGRFGTGVCVVTTSEEEPWGRPLGMTINSFSSVSLDPPLLLWSIQNNSEVFDTFSQNSHFAINVLSASQQLHSSQYAKKGDHELFPEHYHYSSLGCPIVKEALVSFECSHESLIQAGDHHIILGRILQVNSASEEPPLLFYKGQYCSLAGTGNA
jgi:flavin reductase (DIM6/NTAB) family NADH-FMN oxidoreductase RutF